MGSRTRCLAVAAANVLLLGAAVAEAHTASDWYDSKWKEDHHTGLNITWRFSPGFPDGNKKDRVKGAFADWNNVGQQMKFERLDDADSSYVFDCQHDHGYNGIFHNNIDGPGDTLAATLRCAHPSGALHNFSIKFDEDENWYAGDSNGPNDEHDFGGAADHEVGHATGWKGHFGNSWDVCDAPEQTMCALGPGEKTPYGWRTLEAHDKHTFDGAYPDL